MDLKVFAVRDRAALFYFPPFFVRSNVEAVRMFERLINDSGRFGARSDYDLSHLGDWDDQSGRFVLAETPVVISNGSDFPANNGDA